jgi:hypothetical protein
MSSCRKLFRVSDYLAVRDASHVSFLQTRLLCRDAGAGVLTAVSLHGAFGVERDKSRTHVGDEVMTPR